MSKFNTSTKGSSKTTNRAGGEAYRQTDELALASLLLTSFLKDQYYRSGNRTQKELVDLVHKVDPIFAAQAAVYARNVFGMRSVSHVVAGELTGPLKGSSVAKSFYKNVAFRPDDVTEILSYVNGKPSHAMSKGLRAALEKFDEYQLSKYKGEKKAIKLVDAVNLVHAHSPAIAKLVTGTLKPAETFETKLSKAGKAENKAEAKADAWRELLENRKIGYLALVRNLRNIAEQAPDLVPIACELLQDEALVAKSKIFPFQFLTAYLEIKKIRNTKLMSAISRAVDISCKNVPRFDGKTLVAIDISSSMNGEQHNISSLFAATMFKAMDADMLTFESNAEWFTANPDDSTITIAENIPSPRGGTNLAQIFSKVGSNRYDRIFILSDMQTWEESSYWYGGSTVKQLFSQYRKTVNPEVRLYSFDLAGYGDMQFPERNVYCVAGWSDKAFDVIKQLESGTSLVEQIKKVKL